MIRFIRIKIYGNTFKNSLRRRGSKVIFITIKICSASFVVLNWYLLKVEMNLGHAHKTRFWYLFGVFSKISDKHPRHFYRRLHPPSGVKNQLLSWLSNSGVPYIRAQIYQNVIYT